MTGWGPLILATGSVVYVLTWVTLPRIAGLGTKRAGRRLQFVVARNLAMAEAVVFLESERYLLVPRVSVRAACRNHKREMFVPKSQIPLRLEGHTTRQRL